MRFERSLKVKSQAASLHRGRIGRVRARRRGSRAQPSRGMNGMIKRVFFDRLNEVAEDIVRGIGVRRQRDLAETRKVSFNGGVRDEPRVLLPITGKRRAVNSRDDFKNSTWRGPRAPRRPTTTTRGHMRRGFHNRKVMVRKQDAMMESALPNTYPEPGQPSRCPFASLRLPSKSTRLMN
jgi:hypothetical protein